jgi:ribonuclease BN (tRNA processing enzyme)
MGNGALGELQRHCGLYDLDAIFLSHLHADHCIDMCAYFVARYYRHDGGRCDPLPVYGPEGTEQRLTTAYADTPSNRPRSRSARSPCTRSGCATPWRRTPSASNTAGSR